MDSFPGKDFLPDISVTFDQFPDITGLPEKWSPWLLTKADNAERVSSYPCRAGGSIAQCLRPSNLLPIADHVRQPVRPTVQVEYQTHCGVGHFLHTVARHIAHSNTYNANITLQLFLFHKLSRGVSGHFQDNFQLWAKSNGLNILFHV